MDKWRDLTNKEQKDRGLTEGNRQRLTTDISLQADEQKDGQTDIHTHIQTDRKYTDRETDRQMDEQIDRHRDRWTVRRLNEETHRWTDGQMDM